MVVVARDARGDVVVDEVGHPVFVDQPVAGGEVEPRLPFLASDTLSLSEGKSVA